MIRAIELYTQAGEFVDEVAIMDPFEELPEVLIFGARTFVLDVVEEQYREGRSVLAYSPDELKQIGFG